MFNVEYYLKQQRIRIYDIIRKKKIIYLDLNFWIKLREENKETNIEKRRLLDKVIGLSESGKCIFPISEITFWEIMKQSDLTTRRATIELVDRWSEGISIINMDERVRLEVHVWLYNRLGKPTHKIEELIWTRLAFITANEVINKLPAFLLQKKPWI